MKRCRRAWRYVVRVSWHKRQRLWQIHENGQFFIGRWAKDDAVRDGRSLARNEWTNKGRLSQLVVHGKNGKIQYEATYGKDPKRFPS